MTTVNMLPLYKELLDYLVDKAKPQEVLAFKVSTLSRASAQELLERQSAGRLTTEETCILGQVEQIERLMFVLKAKALRSLRQG